MLKTQLRMEKNCQCIQDPNEKWSEDHSLDAQISRVVLLSVIQKLYAPFLWIVHFWGIIRKYLSTGLTKP
jgi:membrane protein required for beta-lactamase induction